MKVKTKYVKPVLKKVRLVPSEAVLQACKTRGIFGPEGSLSCMFDAGQMCSTLGS